MKNMGNKIFLMAVITMIRCIASYGQTGEIAVKVYLTDVETGKNIKDARVTLEGFEIPAIEGKYDKKGKYYYFTKIPKGYNTIMSYHREYNEKGFQDVNGLPSVIKLELHNPRNVYYSFEKPVLRSLNVNYKKKNSYQRKLENLIDQNENGISLPTFRYLYEEDPYHIAIIAKKRGKDFINDTIQDMMKALSLEFSRSKAEINGRIVSRCYGIRLLGGNLYFKEDVYSENGDVFRSCDEDLGWEASYMVFFLNKINGEKFSRYNSSEISSLRNMGFTVTGVTYRKIEYFAKKTFTPKQFFNMDSFINKKNSVVDNYFLYELAGVPFQTIYPTIKNDINARYGGVIYGEADDELISSIYFVFPVDRNEGIGLGILDIINEEDLQKKYFFTNSFK